MTITGFDDESIIAAKSNRLLTVKKGLEYKFTSIWSLPEDLGQRILGLPLSLIQAATIWGHPDLTEEKMVARFDVGRLLSDGVEVIYPRLFVQIPFKIVDEILPPPIVDRFDAAVIVPGINPQFIAHLEQNVARSLQIQDIQDDLETRSVAEILAENRIYQRRCKMLERIRRDIDEKVSIEPEAAWRLQFFLSQLTYCKELGEKPSEKGASPEPTQKKKSEGYFGDTYKLCEGCEYFQHREHHEICYHTMTMPSIRSYHALIAYAKALAWWRASRPLTSDKIYAGVAEIKALLPFVLVHRLTPPDKLANDEQIELRRMQWIQELWGISMQKYNDMKEQIASFHSLLKDIQQAIDEGQYARNLRRNALNTRIAQMMNTIDSLETVAKYPMRIALMDACDKLRN